MPVAKWSEAYFPQVTPVAPGLPRAPFSAESPDAPQHAASVEGGATTCVPGIAVGYGFQHRDQPYPDVRTRP